VTALYVDDRYRGAHGIGRYSREVLARLRPDWTPLALDGSPHSPLDAFRAVPAAAGDSLVYSPGYGALVRAPRQILTIHDLIHLELPWPGRAKFAAYYAGPVRRVVRRAGVVLTVSETSARVIREWVRDDRVEVVNAGNGVSDAFVPGGPVERSDGPYLVFVGNTRRHKNLDVVLRALSQVPDVRLVAVVPWDEASTVSSLADASGVGSRVDVIYGVDDARLAELYRGAVAAVMPSTLEGFGLPTLESVSCGTPVIFWRGCEAVAEIVGDRGWAIDTATDAAPWAAAITEAAGSPRRVEAPAGQYDWARTAAIVSDVLEGALGR
jgi:glycosyltransferase involved in cell wall biosynthesis